MPSFATATVDAVLHERRGLQKVETTQGRAYVLTQLTGPVASGDEVVLNTTAVELGLGTGGWHFVHWNLARERWGEPGPGHIMKLRYTSLQLDAGSAEERADYVEPDGLDGMPVVVCSLHSQLAAVAVAFAAAAPGRRLAYVMTDGAALPLALSDLVHDLRSRDLLALTVTAGHAFGGDHESVSVPSALLVARWAGADAAAVAMGPGVVGTGTRYGNTAVEVAAVADAATALGGRAIVAARYSGADSRERHRGLSHHTRTALDLARTSPLVADPDDVDVDAATLLADHGLRVTSMGRTVADDPDFFRWAGAAGATAARLITR